MAKVMESSEQTCDLCCHESKVWGVGECDHPLCLRCTAKLRVLCEQKECPVCRLKLENVIVTGEVRPYSEISRSRLYGDRRFGILFESPGLQLVYEALRENSCLKCDPKMVFRTFRQLRDHMAKTHDLRYCDICVSNLKLFPSEFKAYSRSMLTKHRREGDPDDSSYKGHPLCQFCDDRFLDNDALHAHLRTDHFWCHICESSGSQVYYKDYTLMRKHFKEDHFLCEEGMCREEKFTSVFRSKIDLQAHRASCHARGLSKAEVKQLRQVELGFSYGRSEVGGARSRGGGYVNSRSGRTAQMKEQEQLEVATAMSASMRPAESKRRVKKHSPPPAKKASPEVAKPTEEKSAPAAKAPPEETKPPPGFTTISKPPGLMNIRASQESAKIKDQESTKAKDTIVKIASGSFDPYSKKTDSTVEQPPPGFESVKEKQKGSEWPEIVSAGANVVTVKRDEKTSTESELTVPQQSTLPAGAWCKGSVTAEQPSRKRKKSPKVPVAETFQVYRSPAFPPMSTTKLPSKPEVKRREEETKLVHQIQIILGKDKSKYTEFKTLSGWYRNSEICAKEYMNQCSALFGPNWPDIGPQVAEVFPDERKKFELLALFRPKPAPKQSTKAKKKARGTTVWTAQLPVTSHVATKPRSMLSDSDYPSLATSRELQGSKVSSEPPAWNMVVRT